MASNSLSQDLLSRVTQKHKYDITYLLLQALSLQIVPHPLTIKSDLDKMNWLNNIYLNSHQV